MSITLHPPPVSAPPGRSSRAHHQHDIAVLCRVENGLRQFRHVLDENRLDLARHPHRARQRAPVGGHDRRFAGGVDFGQQQGVDAGQHLDEVLEQVAGAGVAVRLECQHQAPLREGAARGGDGGRHFHRVVAVIVDQGETAAVRQRNLAVALEAPSDALELGQRLDDGRIGRAHFAGDGNRRQRVQHVVHARQVERDLELAGLAVDAAPR